MGRVWKEGNNEMENEVKRVHPEKRGRKEKRHPSQWRGQSASVTSLKLAYNKNSFAKAEYT